MTVETTRHSQLRSILILALTALIWGLAFVAQRKSVESISPFFFNAVRFAIGAVALLPIAIVDLKRAELYFRVKSRVYAFAACVCGVVLCVACNLQQCGLVTTAAGKSAFLTSLYIVFVPLIGILMKRELPSLILPSVIFATVGFVLLSDLDEMQIRAGDLILLVSAVFYALHIIVIDFFVKHCRPIALSCGHLFVASALSMALALIFETPNVSQIRAAALPILYTGVMSTAVAYSLQIIGQKGCNPASASLVMSLESVFSTIGGCLILSETLSRKALLACILLFCGIVMAQIELPRKSKKTL